MENSLDSTSGLSKRIQAMIKYPALQALCDVVFVVGDRMFPAHRAVLACSSPVFRKMFTIGMKETTSSQFPLEIPVPDIDPVSWEISLEYIYTGKAILKDEETALLALSSAHKYQLEELGNFLETFLISKCETKNCSIFYNTAQVYGLKGLENACLSHMQEKFEELAASAKFLEKCGKELLIRILESKNLIIRSEMAVLECITSWIQADVEERSTYLDELLRLVQLSEVNELDLTLLGRKAMSLSCEAFRSALLQKWITERSKWDNEEILHHLIPRKRSLRSVTLTHRLLNYANFENEENSQWKVLPDRNIMARLKVNPSDENRTNSVCPRCQKRYRDSNGYCNGYYKTDHDTPRNTKKEHISLYLESQLLSKSALTTKMKLKFFIVKPEEPSATFSRSLECEYQGLKGRNGFSEFISLGKLREYTEENPTSVLLGINVVLL